MGLKQKDSSVLRSQGASVLWVIQEAALAIQGGGDTGNLGCFRDLAISTTISQKPSASVVCLLLFDDQISLLSLLEKPTVDVAKKSDVDLATGSFCSSCSILDFPPHLQSTCRKGQVGYRGLQV